MNGAAKASATSSSSAVGSSTLASAEAQGPSTLPTEKQQVSLLRPIAEVVKLQDVPVGCTVFSDPGRLSTILLCPASDSSYLDRLSISAPSILLSLLAIAISLRSLTYTKRKDVRARKHSIHDDYWLRKVISPLTVEALIKLVRDLGTDLPPRPGAVHDTHTQRESLERLGKYIADVKALTVAFTSLAIVSSALSSETNLALEVIEDRLTKYKFELDRHYSEGLDCPSWQEAWADILSQQNVVLKAVQRYQDTEI